jgi:hypothetical protein
MPSELKPLTDIYTFDNPAEIYPFLLSAGNPIIEVLKDAPSHIAELFGDTPLHLKAICDPEEDSEVLFIEIQSDLPADLTVDLLDELDDRWWLKVDKDIRKRLAVDV